MAGQSIGDRFVAAQHTIIGSDMSKSICKASTSEVMGPKKKHLDYLHTLTNEPNISIPELVDIIIERSKQPKWVVVFKSLITTHHLMNFGNEKFIQNLASRNSLFSLDNFLDKTGVQGYDMSSYVRRYSLYINQKAIAYRALAYDFTRIQRGKDGVLRTLDGDKLLKALPILQELLDFLLEFNARPDELTNGVVNAAFMLLFKDLIRLFACYNEGMINLLEKYFTMKKNQCKEALDMYKKYLTRMTKVSEMLKVAEEVGIDKGDIPDLTTAPDSLLEALEQHLASLEGKKISSKSTAAAGVNTMNALNSSLQKTDENIQQSALDEEKNRLDAYKKQKELDTQNTHTSSITTVTSSPFQQQPTAEPTSGASSELLQIFAAAQTTTMPTNQAASANFGFPQTALNPMQQQQPYGNQQQPQGFGMGMQPQQPFSSGINTAGSMFGFEQTQPATQPNLFANSPFNTAPTNSGQPLSTAGLLQPTKLGQETIPQFLPPSNPVDSKDLESSLANVVANLHVGGQRANQDFEPKSEKRLTGGVNYEPAITPSPLTFNSSPMHSMGMVPGAQPRMPVYGGGMIAVNTMMPMQQPQQTVPVYAVPYQQVYMQSQQPHMRPLNPNNPFGSM